MLPTQACSYGNEWDLYCAALAEVSSSVKRSTERLRGAEALATLATLQDPGFMSGRQAARDQAWMALGLFWEHNFGMVGPPSGLIRERVAWQRRLSLDIAAYVDKLQADAARSLGGMIRRTGSSTRFFVFNPLSWTRTDYVDLPFTDPQAAHVFDLSTRREVPTQVMGGDRSARSPDPGVGCPGHWLQGLRSPAGRRASVPGCRAGR